MEKSMHPQRGTVWCGFWSGGNIGLFFFENEQGAVNGERYRAMLNEFLLPKFEEEDRRHLVSTGRRTLPHSQRYNEYF